MLSKRNEFILVGEEEKVRQVHHPTSFKRNKENKGDFTGMTKEGQNPFSLCEDEEEGIKKGWKA